MEKTNLIESKKKNKRGKTMDVLEKTREEERAKLNT